MADRRFPIEMISALHNDLLRTLAGACDTHISGLRHGARLCRGKLSSQQVRRLHNLDVSYNVIRHLIDQFAHRFSQEISVSLSPDVAQVRDEGQGREAGHPNSERTEEDAATKTEGDKTAVGDNDDDCDKQQATDRAADNLREDA